MFLFCGHFHFLRCRTGTPVLLNQHLRESRKLEQEEHPGRPYHFKYGKPLLRQGEDRQSDLLWLLLLLEILAEPGLGRVS